MPPAQKIVVIAPQKERQVLRSCGVLPDRCFQDIASLSNTLDEGDISPVCLWPYNIDYANTGPLVENLQEVQADVPAFLGLGIAENNDQIKANEKIIASIFGAIVLHIVFLDEQISSRGYVRLNPLEEISEWGMNFRKAVDSRFPNEYNVHFKNHVLVLVSRYSQVSATEKELQKFRASINHDGSGVFCSCYFMDYNLFIGETSEIYHSEDVWSIMVSRLIMAFMLSLGADIRRHFWQCPGVKVWNAQECMVSIERDSGIYVLDDAFQKTLHLIQEKIAVHDSSNLNEELKSWASCSADSCPDDFGLLKPDYTTNTDEQPEWRTIPKGGWSNFDAKKCAANTADDNRWKNPADEMRITFHKWINSNSPTDFSDFVHKLFENIKRSSALLFSSLDILSAQMDEACKSINMTENEFKAIAQTEQQRRKVLEDIRDEAVEMDRARAHYVGYGMGLFITVAIALMFGWGIWRITQLLGGDVVMPIVLTGAIWAGSLLAMLIMLGFHSKRGKKGVSHIIEQSKEADTLMAKRDQHAKNILVQSIEMRNAMNINAIRFRVWALLKRTQSILQTELQPYPPVILETLGHVPEAGTSNNNTPRDKFLAKTRKSIGPFPITNNSLMEKDIEALANAAVFGNQENQQYDGETFCKLWRRICSTDSQNMGYHPAKLFINEVHSFVLQYLEKLVQVIDRHVIQCNRENIRTVFEDWFNAIENDEFAHFATAAINGTVLNDVLQLRCFVFIKNGNEWIKEPHNYNENDEIVVKPSTAMDTFPILAFRYQEYCVDFDLTVDGLLTFKEVRND